MADSLRKKKLKDLQQGESAPETAIHRWRAELGEARVITDKKDIDTFVRSTFDVDYELIAIIRPSTHEEVQAAVRIANECLVRVYPISRGMNWGYGSRAPSCDHSVAIDLSDMNRIVEVNQELAYAVVQPGVTQQQLSDRLKSLGGKLWIDATGSSPHSSILGNALDRGHGLTPYGDHADHVCSFEVVLASGQVIRTGPAAFPGSAVSRLDRWSLGPSLDGLFCQSNFGIVTEMTIWLMPKPDFYGVFFYGTSDYQGFSGLVDRMREMKLAGTIRAVPHFGNDYFMVSRMTDYPWEAAKGSKPLSRQLLDAARIEHGVLPWNGMVGLYGTERSVRGAADELKAVLDPHCSRAQFICASEIDMMSVSPQKKIDLSATFRHLGGEPVGTGVKRVYWRKRDPAPSNRERPNPEEDRCGVIAIPSTIPFTGDAAVRAARIVESEFLRFGFEPHISMVGIRPRVLQMHAFIIFDRDDAKDDRNALALEASVHRELGKEGFLPHRESLSALGHMERGNANVLALLEDLKKVFDPNGILAPGRYVRARSKD